MQLGVQPRMAVTGTPVLAPQRADAPSFRLRSAAAAVAPPQQRPESVVLPRLQQIGPQKQHGMSDQPVRQRVQLVQQLATQEDVQPSDQMLDATLKHERQLEGALRVENDQLRAELTRWQDAGTRVADREAKVVEIITSMT